MKIALLVFKGQRIALNFPSISNYIRLPSFNEYLDNCMKVAMITTSEDWTRVPWSKNSKKVFRGLGIMLNSLSISICVGLPSFMRI